MLTYVPSNISVDKFPLQYIPVFAIKPDIVDPMGVPLVYF